MTKTELDAIRARYEVKAMWMAIADRRALLAHVDAMEARLAAVEAVAAADATLHSALDHWQEQAEQLQGAFDAEQRQHADTLRHNAEIGTALTKTRAWLAECKDDYIRVHGERNEALRQWASDRARLAEYESVFGHLGMTPDELGNHFLAQGDKLAEAEAVIKQIAHDDLEFGPLKMSARARHLMDSFLRPANSAPAVASSSDHDIPLCAGHADWWFTSRNHLSTDECVACAFEGVARDQPPVASRYACPVCGGPSDETGVTVAVGRSENGDVHES